MQNGSLDRRWMPKCKVNMSTGKRRLPKTPKPAIDHSYIKYSQLPLLRIKTTEKERKRYFSYFGPYFVVDGEGPKDEDAAKMQDRKPIGDLLYFADERWQTELYKANEERDDLVKTLPKQSPKSPVIELSLWYLIIRGN